MHGGEQCPGCGCIGECAAMNYMCDDVNGGKSKVFIAALYIWDKSFNDSEQVAKWFLSAGADAAVVKSVLFDSKNGDRNGFSPEGSRSWNVVFSISKEKLAAFDEKLKREKLESCGLSHNPCQGCEAFYTGDDISGMCTMEFEGACAWIVKHDDALSR